MNYEKLLTENLKNVEGLSVNREGFYGGGTNPFESYQVINKFQTPYSFPSTPIGQNPFLMNDGAFESVLNEHNNGYGLKFGSGTGYGNTAVETQSHYGAPMMQHKGGKLKGAALSALTLLAFLFFLNLLQNCLKEQMDAMNPTVCDEYSYDMVQYVNDSIFQVMVMSAGQRTYLINRNRDDDDVNEALRNANENFDNASLDELEADEETQRDYPQGDYGAYPAASDKEEQTSTTLRTRIRTKNKSKRYKSKAHATQSSIGPKLKNLSVVHNTMAS
jgi:hypothetical protein